MSMILYAEFGSVDEAERAGAAIRRKASWVQSYDVHQPRGVSRQKETESSVLSVVPIYGYTTPYYAGNLFPLLPTNNMASEGAPFDRFPIAREDAPEVGETAEKDSAVLLLEIPRDKKQQATLLCQSLGGHMLWPANESR